MSKQTGTGYSDIDGLADGVRRGEVRALARALTLADIGGEDARTLLNTLNRQPRVTPIIGITGPPGAGKSTLISAIIRELRSESLKVAALAVDPSSPKSGGAILGDRARMGEHGSDPGVFIRSIASRGHLGGLALNIQASLDVLNAAGFDVVILETVGAGQSEVEVSGVADATVVISAPGLGDDLQAIKAGILEIADILVVNKADLPGARSTAQQLTAMLTLRSDGRRDTPVIETVATGGAGIVELVDEALKTARAVTPAMRNMRADARAADRLAASASELVRAALAALDEPTRQQLIDNLRAGTLDPLEAVRDLLAR